MSRSETNTQAGTALGQPGLEHLTRIRRAAANVLGNSPAGREVLELCDDHAEARDRILDDRSSGLTVVAAVGATGQGKSWIVRQLIGNRDSRKQIKSGNNADEAEELTQDVFVQAMQKLQQLRVPEAFGGWLRRIVHRMAINRLTRRRAALACDPETLEATCFSIGSPDDIAEGREQAAVIRNSIDRLGSLDQQTLKAFYLQSKSLIEMSDQFEAPVGTIKRRLHVARQRLAKEMDVMQAV